MARKYCYKVKFNYLKVNKDSAYSHAGIEKFGFSPIMEEFEEGALAWGEGWAKPVTLSHESVVGRWIKGNIESIYKAEKKAEAEKGEASKWLKEIIEGGYEFDADGKLIENEKAKEDIQVQLCVMATGSLKGLLFINVGGAMELYDAETLSVSVPAEIKELEDANVVFRKRFYDRNK